MNRIAKLVSLILALALIASVLAGCAENPLKAVAGTYKGEYTKFVGDDDSGKVTDEEFSLDLKANGTGVHHRNGEDFDLTWTLDGEVFTMQETFLGIKLDYTGTLKDGKLDIFNADPENPLTVEYVYSYQK